MIFKHIINPRRACAARVTVLGSVCLCVCLLSHISPTERLFVLKTLSRTQRATKVKKFVHWDLLETTAFKSYAAKHERKSQYANFQTYRCQLSPLDTQRRARGYPTIVNHIQPCPKLCLLMPLARVGARTDSTRVTATTRGVANFRARVLA